MPTGGVAQQPTQRRSRSGCYTCKFRKVACKAALHRSEDNNLDRPRDCANCKRLGFRCRWQPPAPGERYDPPPKRRRAVGRRVSDDEEQYNEEHDRSQDAGQSAGTALSGEANLGFLSQPAVHDQDNQFQFLDSSMGLDSGYLDLNLAGEGLDFIPLPAVDPAILTESCMEWPLSLDIEQITQPFGESDPVIGEHDDSPPSITDQNRHLIQHYLEVIKGYSKLDERSKEANNLFISAFSRSLSFPPLFYAILAFSASHMSMQDESYFGQAAKFDTLAAESFQQFRNTHETEVDSLLSALFVRIKMVHVIGGSVDSFLELIVVATEIVVSKHGSQALEDPTSLAWRIIIRIAILDARASCYCLGGGALISKLKNIPSFSFLFIPTSQTPASLGAVVNLLRADVFRVRVAEIDLQLQQQIQSEFVTLPPIRTEVVKSLYLEIQQEIERWQCYIDDDRRKQGTDRPMSDEKVLDSTTYGSCAVLAALHSALLYLHHVFPLSLCHQETSISTILRYQLEVEHDDSRTGSPSSILPSSLFMAGLLTTDPIHRDWVIKIFKKGERWGVYIQKARRLLEEMARLQSEGKFVSIRDAMDQVTGRFII